MSAQLAILGLLVEQPLHGYAIEQLIEDRGMRKWTPIGFSSIYYLLDQLEKEGLAKVKIESAPGRGKERRVHTVTSEGRRRWQSRTLEALSDATGPVGSFLLALSGIPLLKRTEAVTALEQRLAGIDVGLDELARDRQAARPVPDHVEAMFAFTCSRLNAERDWLRTFLSDSRESTPEETQS